MSWSRIIYMTSPCNNYCELDSLKQNCLSCRRTIKEIMGWSEMSASERELVIKRLKSESKVWTLCYSKLSLNVCQIISNLDK